MARPARRRMTATKAMKRGFLWAFGVFGVCSAGSARVGSEVWGAGSAKLGA